MKVRGHYRRKRLPSLFIFLFVFFLPFTVISANDETDSFRGELEDRFPELHFEGRSPAVLLIHGFGGSPIDMKPLADELRKNGTAFNAIVLPGHGTTHKDLENIVMKEWLYASFSAYDEMKKQYDEVYIVGFSMGGALALCIAGERDVNRIVLLSPYFRVKEKWYYFGSPEEWALRFNDIMHFIQKPKTGQINDPAGLQRYAAYEYLPLKTISELSKLGEFAKKKAKNVRSETLWIHSTGDIVADFDMSKRVFDSIPSKKKHFQKYEKSNHIILYDYDSEDAIRRIVSFLGGDLLNRDTN